jgi:ribosomal protein S28E/S33
MNEAVHTNEARGPTGWVAALAGRAIRPVADLGARATLEAVDVVLGSHLIQEVVDRTLASGLADQIAKRVLEGPELERIAATAVDSPNVERVVTRMIQSRLMDEVVARLLDSDDLWILVEEIAGSPAVTAAISQQGVGFADQIAGELRARSRRADSRLEHAARRIAHRGAAGNRPAPAP